MFYTYIFCGGVLHCCRCAHFTLQIVRDIPTYWPLQPVHSKIIFLKKINKPTSSNLRICTLRLHQQVGHFIWHQPNPLSLLRCEIPQKLTIPCHCPISLYGGFLKWWYPTTMGFPTRNDHFGVFWGYHHLRKPPYIHHPEILGAP